MPTINQQIQQAHRKQRALLTVERLYFADVRREFKAWLSRLLQAITAQTGIKLRRFDALSDDLTPLFNNAVDDWLAAARRLQGSIAKHAQTAAAIAAPDPMTELLNQMRGTQRNIARYQQAVAPILDPQIMDELRDFAAENASLINKLGTDAAERIKQLTLDAIKDNTPASTLAEQIMKVDKSIGQVRARTIATDQIGKLQARITRIQAERSGRTRYRWITQQDRRVRPSHRALHGSVREWSDSPTPGSEINCRCVAIPLE